MNKLKISLIALLMTALIAFTVWDSTPKASASVATFRADLIAAFTNVNNFSATQRNEIANTFVITYSGEWNARLRANTVDNTNNRGQFAVDKIIDYMKDVRHAALLKSARDAVPTPTPLP